MTLTSFLLEVVKGSIVVNFVGDESKSLTVMNIIIPHAGARTPKLVLKNWPSVEI